MSIDFGIIEGLGLGVVGIGDLLYVAATEIFGVEAVVGTVEGIAESAGELIAFTKEFVGDEGIQALNNIIKEEPWKEGFSSFDWDMRLDKRAWAIWKELEGAGRFKSYTFNDFLGNVKTVGSSMAKNGLDLTSDKGKDLLFRVINRTVKEVNEKVVKNVNLDTVSKTIIGTTVGNEVYNRFLKAGKKVEAEAIDLGKSVIGIDVRDKVKAEVKAEVKDGEEKEEFIIEDKSDEF
jgi:hypothetical protein